MSQIAGLQDFRQEGPPADISTFQFPCSILVFQHTFGGTTYVCAVRSGVRGWILIDYGILASTVVQSALNSLTAGRTWKEQVTLIGNFAPTLTINIPNYTIIEIQGNMRIPNGNPDITYLLYAEDRHDIVIRGGTIDGNRTNLAWVPRLVNFLYCYNILVEDMVVRSGSYGVLVYDSHDTLITGCDVSDTTIDGIRIERSCYLIEVTQCYIHDINAMRPLLVYGQSVSYLCYEIHIHNNRISHSIFDAACVSVNWACLVQITDNTLIHTHLTNPRGVWLENHRQDLVQGNMVYFPNVNYASGVIVDRAIDGLLQTEVVGNLLINAGINVEVSEGDGREVSVCCNAIFFNSTGGPIAINFVVQAANTLSRVAANSNMVVFAAAVLTGSGINMANVRGGIVSDNQLYNVLGAWNGIHLYGPLGTQNVTVTDNLIDGATIGINEEAGSNYNRIFDNAIRNATTVAIINGSDTVLPQLFFPVPDPDGNIGTHACAVLTDGIDITVRMEFAVPKEFQQLVTADVVLVPGGTGDLRRRAATNFGKMCVSEAYNTHTDSIAAGQVAVTINEIECIDISAVLTGLAMDDIVGIEFTREGSNANDTVNADCYMLGIRVRYV